MLVEKLNDLCGHLITNVKVDELFLSYMTEKSAVFSNMHRVCTPLLLVCCGVIVHAGVGCFVLVFLSPQHEQK